MGKSIFPPKKLYNIDHRTRNDAKNGIRGSREFRNTCFTVTCQHDQDGKAWDVVKKCLAATNGGPIGQGQGEKAPWASQGPRDEAFDPQPDEGKWLRDLNNAGDEIKDALSLQRNDDGGRGSSEPDQIGSVRSRKSEQSDIELYDKERDTAEVSVGGIKIESPEQADTRDRNGTPKHPQPNLDGHLTIHQPPQTVSSTKPLRLYSQVKGTEERPEVTDAEPKKNEECLLEFVIAAIVSIFVTAAIVVGGVFILYRRFA